jgi:hypothetical protein
MIRFLCIESGITSAKKYIRNLLGDQKVHKRLENQDWHASVKLKSTQFAFHVAKDHLHIVRNVNIMCIMTGMLHNVKPAVTHFQPH